MRISIIVPTFNRADTLVRCLTSVADVVAGNDDVEVLVIDNGSTDRTCATFTEIAKNYHETCWRYFYDDMPGGLTGRHLGAKEARGEILAYTADDVLLAPSWLDALRSAFSDPKVILVGGPSRPHYETDPPVWLNALWEEFDGGRMCGHLSLIDLGVGVRPLDPIWIWTVNFSIRKAVLHACGGFHPFFLPKSLQRYQGDGETGLALKITAKGLTGLYCPDVAVTHLIPASRLTPEYFERRAFNQGVYDSYTRIRRNGAVPPHSKKSWKDRAWPIVRELYRKAILFRNEPKFIVSLMRRAHAAGVAFHENEVRNDPKLLGWVLKPDYFDYSLPEGWRNYLDGPLRRSY